MTTLSQRERLAVLGLYVGMFVLLCRLALGRWLPPTTPEGLWFYSGIAALLLGAFLTSPFFTKPADALPNAVAAAFAIVPIAIPPSTGTLDGVFVVRSIALVHVTGVIVLAVAAMYFASSESDRGVAVSKATWNLTTILGAPRVMFSVVFVYALWAFHSDSSWELLILGTGWVFMIAGHPVENAFAIWKTVRAVLTRRSATSFGTVVGRQIPSIVLVKHPARRSAECGDILVVGSDDRTPELAVALDHVGTADGRWLRCALLPISRPERVEWALRAGLGRIELDDVWHVGRSPNPPVPMDALDERDAMIGVVAAETDINELRFEIVRDDTDLAEGDLVSVRVGRQQVLYQVLNGLTQEEIVQQKNTRGFVTSRARKVGIWNAERRRLDSVAWLPAPNAVVGRESRRTAHATWEYVGHLPHTAYGVAPAPHALVTHSTAVLGVLGSGKSLLACELVERMVEKGTKVFVLDLSNQYAAELAPFRDASADEKADADLATIGTGGKTKYHKDQNQGGSIREFEERLQKQLTAFLAGAGSRKVRILNPARFEVWRQDGRWYKDDPPMASLTPPEITRCVAEALLACTSQLGMTEEARCCLVLEEAHSLVPEFNAIAQDSDKAATNGTAKAILQGRKFGFGCLLVTQRTANVTKSLLNQCNTIFALQVFDATGIEFLKNYIGGDHAGILSSLAPRHAVVYGRGLSCATPVVVRLNDRKALLDVSPLRPQKIAPSPATAPAEQAALAPAVAPDKSTPVPVAPAVEGQ